MYKIDTQHDIDFQTNNLENRNNQTQKVISGWSPKQVYSNRHSQIPFHFTNPFTVKRIWPSICCWLINGAHGKARKNYLSLRETNLRSSSSCTPWNIKVSNIMDILVGDMLGLDKKSKTEKSTRFKENKRIFVRKQDIFSSMNICCGCVKQWKKLTWVMSLKLFLSYIITIRQRLLVCQGQTPTF